MNLGNIPIIGQNERNEENELKQQIMMQQLIQRLPVIQCPKCGGHYFDQVFMLRCQPVPNGQPQQIFPDQAFKCSNSECGYVLGSERGEGAPTDNGDDSCDVPQDVQEEKEELPEDIIDDVDTPKIEIVR